jgi:hypothetical protein
MLSRDGLVLGAHPEGDAEAYTKSAWIRFAALGDAERSYVEFPDQTWAFVRRGSYAAFAVADASVRPGVLVDLLEQALMAGEVERVHDREAMRLPEAPFAPSGKPRTSLHRPERAPDQTAQLAPEATIVPEPAAEVQDQPEPEAVGEEPEEAAAQVWNDELRAESEGEERPREDEAPQDPSAEEETEVDRILLAKEFAGLLQVPKEDDEASR